jgi:hypothetical protein
MHIGHRKLAEPGREGIGRRVLGGEFTRREQITVDGLGQRLPGSCPVIAPSLAVRSAWTAMPRLCTTSASASPSGTAALISFNACSQVLIRWR